MKRPETGPMQFGDDWPGIFIRGDAALAFAMYLETYMQCGDVLGSVYSTNLVKLLRSCDALGNPSVQAACLNQQNSGTANENPESHESAPEAN